MLFNRHIFPPGIITTGLFLMTLFFTMSFGTPSFGTPSFGQEQSSGQEASKALVFTENSNWKPCHFGGDGPIEMKSEVLSLGFGDPFTGVRWEGDFPKQDYEITMESRRVGGFDFFCGLTLPAGKERFSLILGGWGGSLIGLSSIDGLDASNNETMMIRDFKKDQWYKIRVQVTAKKIVVWLDEEEIISIEREGRVFDVRSEMEESTPVGIAAYQCESEVRKVSVRSLPSDKKPNEPATPPATQP